MLYPRMTRAVPIPFTDTLAAHLRRNAGPLGFDLAAWRLTGGEGSAMSTSANGVKRFERTPSEQSQQVHVLRLYVGGASPKSQDAIRNVKRICDEALTGRYTLEIVDIYQQTHRAALDQVVAVPVLVRQLPLPPRRFVGKLSHSRHVLRAFGVMNTDGEVDESPDRG
jgi:circadian clock protein KaiB